MLRTGVASLCLICLRLHISSIHTCTGGDADFTDGQSERSRRRGRSSRRRERGRGQEGQARGHGHQDVHPETDQKTSFEPILRPQPQHALLPAWSSAPEAETLARTQVPMQGQVQMQGQVPMQGQGILPGTQGHNIPAGSYIHPQALQHGAGAIGGQGYDVASGSPTRPPAGSILKHPGINLGKHGQENMGPP